MQTPGPTAIPTPVATPTPAPPAGPVTRTFHVSPQQPTVADVAPQDKVTPRADGGIDIVTTRDADFPLHMDWSSFRPDLPAGATISLVEARVCGLGSGDFYEVYGPYGSDPVEYEVRAPAADGCWHFVGQASDWDVTVYVYGDAAMTIQRIEFVVTSDR